MSFEDDLLRPTRDELDVMVERLEELRDWADGEGLPALAYKIAESLGPLGSAVAAAEQYADGTLDIR